jgi:hypothetical protein
LIVDAAGKVFVLPFIQPGLLSDADSGK